MIVRTDILAMPTYNCRGSRDPRDFEIAIFCALGLEADAMIAMFDEIWEQEEQYDKCRSDTNSYTFGRIHQHSVVLVHMPRMGKISASSVAASLRLSFPYIRVGLLVGICGGVPVSASGKREIILGDVLIGTHIVQIDLTRLYPHTLLRKSTLQDNLGRPSQEIGGFLSKLQTQAAQTVIRGSMQADLATVFKSVDYPGTKKDKLFEASYSHKHADAKACSQCRSPDNDVCAEASNMSCTELGCDLRKVISRARIQAMNGKGHSTLPYCPAVHFGGLASGDQVIKSALHRDRIAEQEGVIGFEMEGAGLWDTVPTVVVKGVCDYADSHKNKEWQLYAAATAAACAKGMLNVWRGQPKPAEDRSDKESASSPIHQVFSGNFTAGKNVLNGGTYTADTFNF
jgi:nucleoside phosphorylase